MHEVYELSYFNIGIVRFWRDRKFLENNVETSLFEFLYLT